MILNKEELTRELAGSMNCQMVTRLTSLIEDNEPNVMNLLEVSFHQKKEVAFRAAWMLEYVVTNKPLHFYEHVVLFLGLLPGQKNQSAMRHYAKIVALLTERKSSLLYKSALYNADLTVVIETLFIWLVDDDVLVATKVHCMQALANLVPDNDWIKEELLATIDHLSGIESYAFFARAKMIRKQLSKL